MNNNLLFGSLGVVQIVTGSVLVWAHLGHTTGIFGVAAFSALLVSAVLKILAGFLSENAVIAQRSIGGSFLLDGIAFVTYYHFQVEIGVYEPRLWAYVLAALSALTLIGIGTGILRDQTAFPIFITEQS
jgi:hypothetical protein